MATHKVFVNLPSREIGKVDVLFDIIQNDQKLGQINISKGGLDYYPSNSKKPIKIKWKQFDKMIREWNEG